MTKLKLELAQEAGEILTREELKRILGGAATGSDPCPDMPAYERCTGRNPETNEDFEISGKTRTGCPPLEKNPCPSGLYSCTCVPQV